jgi:hypothetical protein
MEDQVRAMSGRARESNSQQMSHSRNMDKANRGPQATAKGVIFPKTRVLAPPRISKSTQWILEAVLPHLTQIVDWMTLRITHMTKSRSTNKKCPMWWKSTQVITHLPQIWLTLNESVRELQLTLHSQGVPPLKRLVPSQVSQSLAKWSQQEPAPLKETCIQTKAISGSQAAPKKGQLPRNKWSPAIASRIELAPERHRVRIQGTRITSRWFHMEIMWSKMMIKKLLIGMVSRRMPLKIYQIQDHSPATFNRRLNQGRNQLAIYKSSSTNT